MQHACDPHKDGDPEMYCKGTQKPHPKQADYGVLRPFQHVSVDTLGPFSPPALGDFKYAANFVDQQTLSLIHI